MGNLSQGGKTGFFPAGCANRHLLATLGPDVMDLVGTEFLKILTMNAIILITPSPVAHDTR